MTSLTTDQGNDEIVEMVKVSVEDSGAKIPAEHLQRAFDRFSTEHGATHRQGSLGLAVCKEIIARHQGEIWVDTGTMGGVQVCFTVPVGHLRMITETFDV